VDNRAGGVKWGRGVGDGKKRGRAGQEVWWGRLGETIGDKDLHIESSKGGMWRGKTNLGGDG